MGQRPRDASALHPDLDPRAELVETVFGDYREVAGQLLPFVAVKRAVASGEWLQTLTVVEARAAAMPEAARYAPPRFAGAQPPPQ